ncbi:MAG: hypothetical protein WD595_01865 [Waddliaceae bacterium]
MNSQRSTADRLFRPFQFVLKEGKEHFDYSLVMLQVNTFEVIRSPIPNLNLKQESQGVSIKTDPLSID